MDRTIAKVPARRWTVTRWSCTYGLALPTCDIHPSCRSPLKLYFTATINHAWPLLLRATNFGTRRQLWVTGQGTQRHVAREGEKEREKGWHTREKRTQHARLMNPGAWRASKWKWKVWVKSYAEVCSLTFDLIKVKMVDHVKPLEANSSLSETNPRDIWQKADHAGCYCEHHLARANFATHPEINRLHSMAAERRVLIENNQLPAALIGSTSQVMNQNWTQSTPTRLCQCKIPLFSTYNLF